MYQLLTKTFAVLGVFTLSAGPWPAWAGTYKQLYAFHGGSDGMDPQAGLVSSGKLLYGTTSGGGASGGGTVFSVDPTTGSEAVVHSFQANDGPMAGLVKVGTVFYGTTVIGAKYGSVFSLQPKTGAESLVYAFQGISDGSNPEASLINVGGLLYGTTFHGGGDTKCDNGFGCGTVFSVNPKTGAETVVHGFLDGADGAYPQANLVNMDGTLYGTTSEGGPSNDGTVFSINLQTGAEAIVHSFQGRDGATPYAGLIKVGTKLYGTTLDGGAAGYGAVFSVNPKTGVEAVLYSFQGGSDGANPEAGLSELGGMLYGTTNAGGAAGYGTVFSVNPKTGVEAVLYSFQGVTDGKNPQAGLVDVKGTLYGTTTGGGDLNCAFGNACGTVFSYKP